MSKFNCVVLMMELFEKHRPGREHCGRWKCTKHVERLYEQLEIRKIRGDAAVAVKVMEQLPSRRKKGLILLLST